MSIGKRFYLKTRFNRVRMGLLVLTALGIGFLAGYSSQPATRLLGQSIAAYAKGKNENQAAIDKGNVPKLWQAGDRGQGMVVAVIDSGIQPHQDLRLRDPGSVKISKAAAQQKIAQKGYGRYVNAKIPFAYDYTTNSNQATEPDEASSFHGEHVAGIIAANGPATKKQKEYVVGVAPEAQLLDLRVSDMIGDETKNDVARAIYDAVDLGADVINISLGVSAPNQSSADEEQAAVQYAIAHGVFVALAAGNAGHSASIYTRNPLAETNAIQTAYQAVNSGTLTDPGVSPNAMTVAAENSERGSQAEMAPFSSWGPTPTFGLKPDVAAPGMGINSTWQNNSYSALSGTSMASPYVAGAAALVLQRLKQVQPDLTGSQLVMTAKNMLMNSAVPIRDANYADKYHVSPRRQGAGQINVAAAAGLQVTAKDSTTGIASESLGLIGHQKSFKLTLTNHGTKPVSYTFNGYEGPMTEIRDKKNGGRVHDIPLKGATLSADQNQVTVAPGQSREVVFNLTISPTVNKNQVVEGFLQFKADQAGQAISVPYLAYYGDPTQEQIIDSPAFMTTSIFHGGYLVDNTYTPLGISDQASLSAYVNGHADQTNWQTIVDKIHPSRVAFSPNGDGRQDVVMPFVFAKQSLANVTARIVNDQGRVVRVIDQEPDTDKSVAGDDGNLDLSTSFNMRQNPNALQWDGRYVDQKTGRSIVAPNGRYHYQLVTTNYNQGADKQQLVSYPLEVDNQSPRAFGVVYNAKTGRLAGRFSDRGAGFTSISEGILKVAGHQFGVRLTRRATLKGTFNDRLNQAAQAWLQKHSAKLQLTDIAGNQISVPVRHKKTATTSQVAAGNLNRVPQFRWLRYGTGKDASSTYVEISNQKSFVIAGRVPKNVSDLTAFAKDTANNKIVKGKIYPKTGIVTFKFHFGKTGYETIRGWSQLSEKKFGAYSKSTAPLIVISRAPGAIPLQKIKRTVPKLSSNKQAAKKITTVFGTPIPSGHKPSQLTNRTTPSKGIKFSQLRDNAATYLNRTNSAAIYDSHSEMLTINGRVNKPKQQKLVILATPDENDPSNQVTLSKNGRFSFKVPFKPTEQRGVGYDLYTRVKAKNGHYQWQKQRGVLEIYLDVVTPTLDVTATSNGNQVTIKGSANDNVSGVKVYVNENNLFSQSKAAGFNQHTADQPLNPYPAYQLDQTYALNAGANHFTIKAVDQVGNVTTKTFSIAGQ